MIEAPARPTVQSAALQFELDPDHGVFHLLSGPTGDRVASNLECQARFLDETVTSRGSRSVWRPLADEAGIEVQFRAGEQVRLDLVVRRDEIAGGLALTLSIHNEGPRRTLLEAAVLSTGAEGTVDFCPLYKQASFLEHGWLGWDSARTVRPGLEASDPIGLKSSLVSCLACTTSGLGLLLGFAGASLQFSEIRLHPHDETSGIEAVVDVAHRELAAGHSVLLETLWTSFGAEPALLLCEFGRYRGQDRVPERVPVVWTSWFTKFEETTEEQVLASLDSVRSHFPDLETAIVGDGYQRIQRGGPGVGDWKHTNDRFPHGLRWLSDQIRRRGLRPGLWLAPFLIGERSQFYKYYPDALLRNRDTTRPEGWEMWRGDRVFYLDTTHPDARHYLRDLFESLSFRYGFDVFHIDFAYAAAVDGFRRDPNATGAQALEQALEQIRRAVGPDRTLLLSGAPMAVGSNSVDAAYVGPDVAPGWNGPAGTLASIRSAMARSFLGAGAPALATGPILVGPEATEAEVRVAVTVQALTGGVLSLGESPLDAPKASILRQALPTGIQTAVPLDLFERQIPQLYGVAVPGSDGVRWVVAVLNTTDAPITRTLDLTRLGLGSGKAHAYEYWDHRYLGLFDGGIVLENIPAHDCRVLTVQADLGRPQFLSADDGILQGSRSIKSVHWDAGAGANGRLAVEMAAAGKQTITCSFFVPEAMLVRSAESRNARVSIVRKRSLGRLLAVEASFRDHCRFELQF